MWENSYRGASDCQACPCLRGHNQSLVPTPALAHARPWRLRAQLPTADADSLVTGQWAAGVLWERPSPAPVLEEEWGCLPQETAASTPAWPGWANS